ncbi:MucR family transcriptional regulator [Actinophytocola oryzae]|uniref:ROS/MUCR transcriptional regulator protein n=1 Tax=Actinophytocola oryzae TaxID=502181 RepID=A0A4R7VFL8_9PSEU|nr:MucR family transcriptional regulator [Actinophytocola oryzae]TDV48043.1 ROS/MUCR transcriptional regulator protein [Actinophytocola oryzae]
MTAPDLEPAPVALPRRRSRTVRAVAAVLPDGTPSYGPIGRVVRDGDRVLCHLCGRWFRSVVAHLRSHGWHHLAYREAFGLLRSEPLEGSNTRSLRAKAMTERRVHDPAVRAGCELGRELVRSGALTRAAARAAAGRRQPEQRRRKTLAALAAISPQARAEGSRRRADSQLRETARAAAESLGFADIGALVVARTEAGASLAAISREAGLHKDWLCRHLSTVAPETAADLAATSLARRHEQWDSRWLPLVRELGFPDVAAYLRDRHVVGNHTVRAIATETGFSRAAVESALRRHGVARHPHATTRARRDERAQAVTARFGFACLEDYFADRRAAGMSWRAIAAECGQPPTWVRRRAGLT